MIYLGILLAVVAAQVFREGPVTGHRIRGAIVIYLLLGGMWAFALPGGGLDHPPGLPPAGRPDRRRSGRAPADADVFQFHHSYHYRIRRYHPGPPGGAHLAMLEALVGQLYPAITLARLVSLAVMHQKGKS